MNIMAKCPRCNVEVTTKCCTKCGALVNPQTAVPITKPASAGTGGEQVECPQCKKTWPASGKTNYCNNCKDPNGRPVRLQKMGAPAVVAPAAKPKIKIKLTEITTGKAVQIETNFDSFGSIDLGRDMLQQWKSDAVLNPEEWGHISRTHFRIERMADGTMFLTDLKSTNGTTLNGVKLDAEKQTPLNPGQEIGILVGKDKTLRFKIESQ